MAASTSSPSWRDRIGPRSALVAGLVIMASVLPPLAVPAAAQDEGFRVGVIVVTAIGVDDGEARAIARRMATTLSERLVVAAEADDTGVPVPETCVVEAGCVREHGQRLGARELLFLAMVRIGEGLQINVTWADTATGNTEQRDPVRIQSTDDDVEIFAHAAARLLPTARRRSRDEAVLPTGGPSTAFADFGDRSTGRKLTAGVWIAGGISVLALAGGTAFGVMALRTESQLESAGCAPGPCNEPESQVERLRFQAGVSDALFMTALVAGATAGILYWRSGASDVRGVVFSATPESAQVSFTGRF